MINPLSSPRGAGVLAPLGDSARRHVDRWLARMSLRAQLMLFAVVSILPLLGYTAYTGIAESREHRERMVADAALQAASARDQLDNHLHFTEGVLASLAPFALARDGVVSPDELAVIQKRLPAYVTNVMIFDPRGRLLSSRMAASEALLKNGIADRRYFQEANRTRGFAVSEAIVGKITKSRVVNTALAFTAEDGKVAGTLVITTNIELLQKELGVLGPEYEIGVHQAADPSAAVLPLKRFPQGPPLTEGAASSPLPETGETGKGILRQASFTRGGERLYLGATAAQHAPWIVTVIRSETVAQSQAALLHEMWVALALVLGMAVLSAFLVKRISRPILELKGCVQAFSTGTDLVIPAGLPVEFRPVTTEFQRMAGRLISQHAELLTEKERFRQLTALSSDWYWETDADFQITLVSQGYEIATGKSRYELIGRRQWEMPAENMAESDWAQHRAALESHRPFRGLILRRRAADGRVRTFRTSGEPILVSGMFNGYRGVATDVTEAFELQAALAASEARWVSALEAAGHGVWDWNLETDKVYFSAEWKRQLGCGEDEVGDDLGEWRSRLHPADQERVFDAWNRHAEGATPRYESEQRLRCKDGTWKWFSAQGTVIQRDEAGRPLRAVGTQTDIEHFKSAERELEEAAAWQKAIFFRSPLAMVIIEIPSRQILAANTLFADMLGTTPDALPGREGADFNLWRDVADRDRLYETLFAEGRVHGMECGFRAHDGSELDYIVFAEKVTYRGKHAVVVQGVDVTERNRAERARGESEAWLKALFRNSRLMVHVSDRRTGATLDVNDGFSGIFGYTKEEMAGRTTLERNLWADVPSRDRIRAEVVKTGRLDPFNVTGRRKDGRTVEILMTAEMATHRGRDVIIASGFDISELKKTESALREALDWFEAVFRTSPIPMIIVRAHDRCIVDLNEAAAGMQDRSRANTIGRTLEDLGVLIDPAVRAQVWKAFAANVPLRDLEMNMQSPAGRKIDLLLSTERVRHEGEDCLLLQGFDITARNQTRRELMRGQALLQSLSQRLQLATQAAAIGIWDLDLVDGRLIWDDTMLRMYGVEPAAVPAERSAWTARIHAEDRADVERLLDLACAGQGDFSAQFRVDLADGEVRHVQANAYVTRNTAGEAVRMVGTHIDITSEVQQQRRLSGALRRLELQIESMPVAAVVVDEAGCVTYWNRAASAVFGYTREEVLGRDMLEFLVAPDHRDDVAARRDALRESDSTLRAVTENVKRDGRSIACEWYNTPLRDEEGRFRGHIGVALDVTARLEAERAKERLNAELEERVQSRTAELRTSIKELETFSYSVAHDLRAPLRAIDAFAQLVADHGTADGRPAEWLAKIRRNVQRMAALIDDLLDYARLGRQEIAGTQVDMRAMAEQVWSELREEYPATGFCIGDLGDAWGDRTMLRQLWTNLLGNAAKFSRHAEAPRIDVACVREGGMAVYTVRDNGIGFDMQFAGKLFGMFERMHSDQAYPGTGVGLAIVQRIVDRHGGSVSAMSRPGEGAVFTFRLPVPPGQSGQP